MYPSVLSRTIQLLSVLCVTLVLLAPNASQAERSKRMMPLASWPAAKVRSLAPLLRTTDIAVFENKADGHLRQLSLFVWVAAPPSVVRDVIVRAEQYKDFVPNFSTSTVNKNPDGTFDFRYSLDYGVFSIDGENRYLQLPADPQMDAPPVEIRDIDGNFDYSVRRYRFEFYDVGGSTVLAMYGYTDITASGGIFAKLLAKVPTLEQGLALVAHDTLILSMKRRAEKLSAPPAQPPVPGSVAYDFLLQRGMVVLLRSQNGRLAEISMVSRSAAGAAPFVQLLSRPQDFVIYIPSITKSVDNGRSDDVAKVDLEQSLPLLSFRTMYGVRSAGNSVDMLGLSGDLRGGRLRFDISSVSGLTQLVLRTSQQYDRGSILIRQLYKLEPLMEFGVNVGLQMVLLVGIQNRAEQLSNVPRSETPIPADNIIYR